MDEKLDAGEFDEIEDTIKKVYNYCGSKAKEIAKIESIGAINDGRYSMMNKSGIAKHVWSHNGDENHKHLNGKIVSIDDTFNSSNLRYPCDVSTGKESLNCTCISLPIVESK